MIPYQPLGSVDLGIDPHDTLFTKQRINQDIQEVDNCISCFVHSIFCLLLPCNMCSVKKVNPMYDTIEITCGVPTRVLREPGPYWIPLFTTEMKDVCMALHTIEINNQNANDLHGSPIVASAQFVYRVVDSVSALFKTSNLEKFIKDQAETALRTVLAKYPYDVDNNEKEHKKPDCLTKQSNKIDEKLVATSQEMVNMVGVKIESFRLINVEYNPRMEKLLLARQEAQAEVTARTTIAEGVTGIIEETIKRLKKLDIHLTEAELNKFVTNLSLTLVNHGHTTLNIFDGTPSREK